jgi:hypothetical protein
MATRNYVYYRHLCYIVPLLVVLVINGFVKLWVQWKKMYWPDGYFSAAVQLFIIFLTATKATPAYRAAGWVSWQKNIRK